MSQLASIVENGGNPANYPDEFENWNKWMIIFRLYEVSRNPRYGNIELLPASGGLLDQPCKTLEAMQIVASEYQKKLAKDLERSLGSIRHR